VSTRGDLRGICAAPGCRNHLPPPTGRGRPRLYCSTTCRRAGSSRQGALVVEIDHTSHDAPSRPLGRVWLVKLRRGANEVVVASDLGRPSADHLAGQLSRLIEPPRRAEGAAMD